MEQEVNITKKPDIIRQGTIAYHEWLGYFIQPDGDKYGTIDIPGVDFRTLPEGLQVGDRVEFTQSGPFRDTQTCRKVETEETNSDLSPKS